MSVQLCVWTIKDDKFGILCLLENARENERKKGKGDQTLPKAVESDRQRRQTDENDAISESSNDTSASLARCEYAEDEINDDKELGNNEKLNQCLDDMTEER